MFLKIKDKGTWDLIQTASTIGLNLVSATFVGMAMGYLLDRWLVWTKPWLMLVFLLLGIVAGFKNVYLEAKRIQASDRQEHPDQARPGRTENKSDSQSIKINDDKDENADKIAR